MICYAFFLFVSNDGDQISYLACWRPESSHCVRLCHLNLWDPWQTLTVLAPVSTRCQHQCLLPKQNCLKSLWYINILLACNNSRKYKEVKIQAALSFLKYSLYAFKIIIMEILRCPSLQRILVLGPATEHMFMGAHNCVCAMYAHRKDFCSLNWNLFRTVLCYLFSWVLDKIFFSTLQRPGGAFCIKDKAKHC